MQYPARKLGALPFAIALHSRSDVRSARTHRWLLRQLFRHGRGVFHRRKHARHACLHLRRPASRFARRIVRRQTHRERLVPPVGDRRGAFACCVGCMRIFGGRHLPLCRQLLPDAVRLACHDMLASSRTRREQCDGRRVRFRRPGDKRSNPLPLFAHAACDCMGACCLLDARAVPLPCKRTQGATPVRPRARSQCSRLFRHVEHHPRQQEIPRCYRCRHRAALGGYRPFARLPHRRIYPFHAADARCIRTADHPARIVVHPANACRTAADHDHAYLDCHAILVRALAARLCAVPFPSGIRRRAYDDAERAACRFHVVRHHRLRKLWLARLLLLCVRRLACRLGMPRRFSHHPDFGHTAPTRLACH